MAERTLDLICMGRAGVDLYGEQTGGRLEDMLSFRKYIGGCPTNISVGASRLGLQTGLITRVGDEHNGRFIRETLIKEGVDVSHVVTDRDRLTALVFLGIRDPDTFPLLFYRDNCADMAIDARDIDPAFVASAKALLVTGTHFSTAQVDSACRFAMDAARAAGGKIVFDIDYRPVLWGLTGKGEGENRYVANERVTEHLLGIVPHCDLIVGTEEEFHIAGGSDDAVLVLKRGEKGCTVYTGAIPKNLDDGISGRSFDIEVYNVLGAGDAFMSGFLRGWLRGEPWETCCTYANASGALVVTRHACAPAIPTWAEMDEFLRRNGVGRHPDDDRAFARLHRATARHGDWHDLAVLAFDHRSQFEDLAAEYGVPLDRIGTLKKLLAEAALEAVGTGAPAGVIIDDRLGGDALNRMTGRGWWVARPVEQPGSRPLKFECGEDIESHLRTWPGEHTAKCLVYYHPDDASDLRADQLAALRRLYDACLAMDRELLLEVIPPQGSKLAADTVARAMSQIYDAGVYPDWWKLVPPRQDAAWQAITEVIAARDANCRGVLLLGLEAPVADLLRDFALAASYPVYKGFAVGRSLFGDPARHWLAGEYDDAVLVAAVCENYRALIAAWSTAAIALVSAEAG